MVLLVLVVLMVMMMGVAVDGDGKSSSCFDGTVLECKSIIQHCQLLIHIVQYEYWLLCNVNIDIAQRDYCWLSSIGLSFDWLMIVQCRPIQLRGFNIQNLNIIWELWKHHFDFDQQKIVSMDEWWRPWEEAKVKSWKLFFLTLQYFQSESKSDSKSESKILKAFLSYAPYFQSESKSECESKILKAFLSYSPVFSNWQ